MLTKEQISQWMQAGEPLQRSEEIAETLGTWPWFVPARLMEIAARQQQEPSEEQARRLHYLYCPNPVSFAYINLRNKVEDPNTSNPVAPAQSDLENQEAKIQVAVASEMIIQRQLDQFYAEATEEDYFAQQGIQLPSQEDEDHSVTTSQTKPTEDPNTLMVMMSFSDWLSYFKQKNQKEEEEAREKSALRSMWQQQKLAAALQEETEEIPEQVFTMAVNSITKEEGLISEPLAKILEKQEKWDAAAEMYQKLALKNPSKSTYFASRAEAAKKRLY